MSDSVDKQSVRTGQPFAKCPICAGASQRRFQKNGYWILACLDCKYRFLEESPSSNQMIYSDDYFFGGGVGYPDYLAEGKLVRAHGQRYAKILNRYVESGCVLDIGAAAGFFLAGLQDEGWKGSGVEPNENMARFGREQLGVNVVPGTLERLPSDVGKESYDLISMVQVVPHYFDIHAAFQTAAAITKDGGYWLIETWNVESFSARIFGQHWHEYSPPSVVRWFSPVNLAKLCELYGFQRVASGRPKKWIKGTHVKSLLSHKLGSLPLSLGKPFLQLVPDNWKFPYPSEDLFWMLLRKTNVADRTRSD